MPFNMFKAFSGSSRRRNHHRTDSNPRDEYIDDFSRQDYPSSRHEPMPIPMRQRREPVFTPIPSRAPTDEDNYYEGYVRVDSPQAVMGGALNARPSRLQTPVPSVERDDGESRLSDALSDHPPVPGMMDDPSRLLDRAPTDLYAHSSAYDHEGDRHLHESPIVLNGSVRSGSDTESDHTIEHLRTPLSSQFETRASSRPHPANYMPPVKSPSAIYGDQPHDIYPYRHRDDEYERRLPGDVQGEAGGRPIYYIIPGGVNVIFQDERGREITRVGDFNRRQPARPAPFVVQDAQGREMYRYDSNHSREGPHRHNEPQIVRIDAFQNDRPRYESRDRSYSSHSSRSDPHRRQNDYRDPRHYDRSDAYIPHGSERSRSSHRSYSHPNISVDRPSRQHSQTFSDDRRSGSRSYEAPHVERLSREHSQFSDDRRSGGNRSYDGSRHSSRRHYEELSNGIRTIHL
ncbi:hypothetical protein BJ138DRAFT_1140364 [Hygrophoropsis aurantiaca]|uniref:Uncharacterized protein n=1 Tax=Hygrophoropsis aurantiaca TaxID=72124 RepID=A0ACB8AT27_9AGAM|nr:hypothetical protein BJ138DRAFT_1140364 [Hygrophoropsis aurantiaca]